MRQRGYTFNRYFFKKGKQNTDYPFFITFMRWGSFNQEQM